MFSLSMLEATVLADRVLFVQVLWAATDGSKYIWREIATQGTPPTPRFHHSCDTFDGQLPTPSARSPLAGAQTVAHA